MNAAHRRYFQFKREMQRLESGEMTAEEAKTIAKARMQRLSESVCIIGRLVHLFCSESETCASAAQGFSITLNRRGDDYR
jgi:hypothetical protein